MIKKEKYRGVCNSNQWEAKNEARKKEGENFDAGIVKMKFRFSALGAGARTVGGLVSVAEPGADYMSRSGNCVCGRCFSRPLQPRPGETHDLSRRVSAARDWTVATDGVFGREQYT